MKETLRIGVVFGNALVRGEPTPKFRARVNCLIEMGGPFAFDVLVFTGRGQPRSEAKAGFDTLLELLEANGVEYQKPECLSNDERTWLLCGPRGKVWILLDERSATTVENAAELRDFLQTHASLQGRICTVCLISDEVQIDRITFIDEAMPRLSVIKPIRLIENVQRVETHSVAYPWDHDADPERRRVAQVYRQTERMLPLQVNLEGILGLEIDNIVPSVVSQFLNSLDSLQAMVHEFKNPQFAACIRRALRLLNSLRETLAELSDSKTEATSRLSSVLGLVRSTIARLRRFSDLDQQWNEDSNVEET